MAATENSYDVVHVPSPQLPWEQTQSASQLCTLRAVGLANAPESATPPPSPAKSRAIATTSASSQEVANDCPDGVYIAFFEHNPWSRVTLFNRLISARMRTISPKYEHCQFVFEWNTTKCPRVTFSTTKRTPSSYVNIAYQDKNWTAVLVNSLDAVERQRLFRWTLRNEHTPFNNHGYYCNFAPPASCCACCAYDADGSAFYCAEQIATGMRMVRVPTFVHARPYLCTPDDVFHLLTDAGFPMLSIKMPQTFVRQRRRTREVAGTGGGSLYNADLVPVAAPQLREMHDIGSSIGSTHIDFSHLDRDDDGAKTESGCCMTYLPMLCGWFCGCSCCCQYPEYQRVRDRRRTKDSTDVRTVARTRAKKAKARVSAE